jgi:hypothetical protein
MFPLPWKKVCGRPCMRVREGVAPTGVEVCRNDHDVEDLLYHHESVGWSGNKARQVMKRLAMPMMVTWQKKNDYKKRLIT